MAGEARQSSGVRDAAWVRSGERAGGGRALHCVLDFTRRTKGARRERIALTSDLVAALQPHFDAVSVLYPRGEASPPNCQKANLVAIDARSDVLCEEIVLPHVLRRLHATDVFTFRETFVAPRGIRCHLHLHEDPYPRKALERHSRRRRNLKVTMLEWRNARRFLHLLRRASSLTTSSRWTLESLRDGPAGALDTVRNASIVYLGGFDDATSRVTPRARDQRSHVLISSSADPRDDPAWALRVYETAIDGALPPVPPAIVFGTASVGSRQARGRIESVGEINDDDRLLELYRSALVYIHPASFEGLGLMPLEALQCGTPVLAPAGSSNGEALGENAFASAASASALLRSLLSDGNAWQRASQAAWLRGQTFQWRAFANAVAARMADAAQHSQDG